MRRWRRQEGLVGPHVVRAERRHRLATLQHGPELKALRFPPVGTLRRRQADAGGVRTLRSEPCLDGFAIRGRGDATNAHLRPSAALAPVERRRNDELLEWQQRRAAGNDACQHGLRHLRTRHVHMGTRADAERAFVRAQPVDDAARLGRANTRHMQPPTRPDAIHAGKKQLQGRQACALQPLRQGGIQPGRNLVPGLRVLRNEVFQPPQSLELPRDEPRATRYPLSGCTLLDRCAMAQCRGICGRIGLELFFLGEVFHAACGGERFERGQRLRRWQHDSALLLVMHRRLRQPFGVKKDQPGRAGSSLAPRGSGKGVAYPRDRATHRPHVGVVALHLEVAVPARALVQTLRDRAHEREMTALELAGRIGIHTVPGMLGNALKRNPRIANTRGGRPFPLSTASRSTLKRSLVIINFIF